MPSPAILDLSFSGTTTATMRITSAAGVQTYNYDYGTTFGPGAGLGTYGFIRLDNLSDSRAAGKILRMQFPPLRCPLPRTCRLRRKWDILGAASSKACLVACGTRLPFYRHSAQALFNRVWIAIGRRGSLYAERVCRAMICSRSVNAESRRGNRITR